MACFLHLSLFKSALMLYFLIFFVLSLRTAHDVLSDSPLLVSSHFPHSICLVFRICAREFGSTGVCQAFGVIKTPTCHVEIIRISTHVLTRSGGIDGRKSHHRAP